MKVVKECNANNRKWVRSRLLVVIRIALLLFRWSVGRNVKCCWGSFIIAPQHYKPTVLFP